MHYLAYTLRRRGDYKHANYLYLEALKLSRAMTNKDVEIMFLGLVGRLYEDMCQQAEAEKH